MMSIVYAEFILFMTRSRKDHYRLTGSKLVTKDNRMMKFLMKTISKSTVIKKK